jgi:GT2 family glycosyltransferase
MKAPSDSGSDEVTLEASNTIPPSSLVICTRNRPELLSETVASILEGDQLPTELVIIDQSDAPHPDLGSSSEVAPCAIRYVFASSKGASRARNEGVEAARHDLLVFTDDDVQVTKSWYGTLITVLTAENPDVVLTGQVLPDATAERRGFVPSIKVDPTPARYRGRIGEDVIYPHNMALRRQVIDRVGPFDPRFGGGARFPAAEDNDFCHRLLEAGCEIRYVPEAVIYHKAWRTYRDYLPLRWNYGRGQGAYYAKHLDLRDRYMAGRLLLESRARFARIFRRWREPFGALGELTHLAGLLTGAAEWIVFAKRST